VKILYSKKGYRGEGERQSFAFFIVGAVVVLVAVFLVGIYFGRELEKGGGARPDNQTFKAAGEGHRPEWSVADGSGAPLRSDNVRRELGAFSEEAVRIPVVPPGRAEAAPPAAESDNAFTFQDSLSRKTTDPVPLEKPKPRPEAVKSPKSDGSPGAGVMVQAGAFKDKAKAEARRKQMEKAGYSVHQARSGKDGKEGLFLVIAGPYPDRDAARSAINKLKSELKIDAIVAK
jgi:cell division septation protein DedD